MDIIAKAKELGIMISESEEMARYTNAEEKVQNDEKALSLFNDYNLLQTEAVKATKEKRDASVIDAIKERLLQKHQEISSYEVTKDFMDAKDEFDRLMHTVNDVIIHSITGEESCGSGGCSSCSGCK